MTSIDQWGPAAWHTLHVLAHTAPAHLSAIERDKYRTVLYAFSDLLPCPSCRRHFRHHLDTHLHDESLRTRETFVVFMNDAHNAVNRRLGKPQWTLCAHYAAFQPSIRRSPRCTVLVAIVAVLGVALIGQRASSSARRSGNTRPR